MREVTRIIKISKRLTTIASYIDEGAYFADIGSDHAYLPCYVCLKDPQAQAIAGEVNQGPFKKALNTVQFHGLSRVIDIRLGDGLKVINNDPVSHVVIAGMGGSLIKRILDEGAEKLQSVKRIITQPNIDAKHVRKWLYENNFIINHEEMIEENNHIYEIVVADQDTSSNQRLLTEKQLLFGPLLLEAKPKLLYKKWLQEKEALHSIIDDMKRATKLDNEKIMYFKNKLAWIEEIFINEEQDH